MYAFGQSKLFSVSYNELSTQTKDIKKVVKKIVVPVSVLDIADYDKRMLHLAHRDVVVSVATTSSLSLKVSSSTGTSTKKVSSTKLASTTVKTYVWPAKTVYPNAGAILPFKRILAFYGNFYSKGMGVLGEYSEDEVLKKLSFEQDKWNRADPNTPVIPAIHYIAVTAQGSAGDGKYRLRMPEKEIDHALEMADKVKGILILDVQVALSNLQTEIPLLEKYLKMPQVHLAIDPEFSMKTGAKPGTVVGTMDATDINYVANYLADLVKKNNLPPKVLIVHRYTQNMVTNYKKIAPLPEVQIVIHMDGWGPAQKKIGTYNQVVAPEPVQFTGFKLFYKNDLRAPSTRLTTPSEILSLTPQPIYIQYQ